MNKDIKERVDKMPDSARKTAIKKDLEKKKNETILK